MRAVGDLWLEVSLRTCGRDPFLDNFFCSQMTCSVSQKVGAELGQAPTSQARPGDTDHLRPSNLAARTLRSVEHTPSKFGHDPCRVRRDSSLQSSVACEKDFFALSGQAVEQSKKPEPCVGFITGGETCFVFCFPIP